MLGWVKNEIYPKSFLPMAYSEAGSRTRFTLVRPIPAKIFSEGHTTFNIDRLLWLHTPKVRLRPGLIFFPMASAEAELLAVGVINNLKTLPFL